MNIAISIIIALSVASFVCAVACEVFSLMGGSITIKHCRVEDKLGSLLVVTAFYSLALAFILNFFS